MSIQTDYAIHLNRTKNSIYKNPFSVGLNVNAGRYSIEFVATTAQSFNEPGVLSNGEGQWNKGGVFPGFNLVRVF